MLTSGRYLTYGIAGKAVSLTQVRLLIVGCIDDMTFKCPLIIGHCRGFLHDLCIGYV